MFWIVAPGPIRAAFAGQDPGIVERIPGAGYHRMVAAGNQHGVPMLHRVSMIEGLRIGRIGVNPHESEALFRLDLEVVDLFHGDFRRWRKAVVLVRWTTGPAARAFERIPGDE